MNFYQILLSFLRATYVAGDLIGWNRLQGAALRSATKQAQFKQIKPVFDQYLMHLGRNSPQIMSELIKIQKLQYRKYLEIAA